MSHGKQKQHVVGVDLGGTKILAAVFDGNFRVLSREKKNTRPELGGDGVIGRVAECVNEALAAVLGGVAQQVEQEAVGGGMLAQSLAQAQRVQDELARPQPMHRQEQPRRVGDGAVVGAGPQEVRDIQREGGLAPSWRPSATPFNQTSAV